MIVKDQAQADLRVSKVFRREGSEWKMVHHHVDLNQPMLEILPYGRFEHDMETRLDLSPNGPGDTTVGRTPRKGQR
jgi:hypothetical protein